MYKINNSFKLNDGSLAYNNENDVLQIDSEHRFPKFDLYYENKNCGKCVYAMSVFSTTGKEKWQDLIDDYNYRCFVSERYGDIVTSYVDRKPHTYMKTSAFSLTIETIKDLIK